MYVLDKIKEIRSEKRISQSEVAEYLGIAHNNYGRIERGEGELTVVRLFKIAEFLKVSPNELLGLETPKKTEQLNDTIEKDKEVEELKKRVSELERSLSEVRKVVDFTEGDFKELCYFIESEIRCIWKQKIYELDLVEEVPYGDDGGYILDISNEDERKVLNEFIFNNDIFYEYFKNEWYKYGNDSVNVISDFLNYFKEYSPLKTNSWLPPLNTF